VLEVREHAAGFEQVEDLAIERSLPVVLEMVDGERRDDSVEASERGERLDKIVPHELDALIAGEAVACRVEHDLREVKADANDLGAIALEKRQQAAVSRPEVEDTTNVIRDMLEQDALSLCAARESIRPVEIAQDTLGDSPLAGGHARIIDGIAFAQARARLSGLRLANTQSVAPA
jgi:hypothetical protein